MCHMAIECIIVSTSNTGYTRSVILLHWIPSVCVTDNKSMGMHRREGQKWRRKCQELQEKLEKHKRLHNKYKKRWHRLQDKGRDIDSPRKKARATLKGSPRKTLIFHYALLGELRAKYKAAKANKDKKAFVNILSGKLIRKYKALVFHTRPGSHQLLATTPTGKQTSST